ncbi:winged helix-turn-helix domain-containing protein [Oceanobacillus sp. 1P07AA]|uniref:winged helix-turn-helix domain-containing protein n=1 Tax=Oceanobacillus sp. 1P07AA TaxID=3132293 RepID=UPI0039A64802
MGLIFNQENYSIHYQDIHIQLLRKEYELLFFLYHRMNRAFTRVEILNNVWENEYPVDRTVDDHIFRLRKKLTPLKDLVTIKTVRGYGYALNVEEQSNAQALLNNKEFNELSLQLMKTYQLYGNGPALKILQHNNKDLGIEESKEFQQLSWLTSRDLLIITKDKTIPFKEKSLLYLHIYLLSCENVKKTLSYFYRIKQKGLFSRINKDELYYLTPILLYILDGQNKKAMNKAMSLNISSKHGFYPFLQLYKLILLIISADNQGIQKLMNQLDIFFLKFPFQREISLFQVLQGVIHINNDNTLKGRERIYEGVKTAKYAGFLQHYLLVFYIALFF